MPDREPMYTIPLAATGPDVPDSWPSPRKVQRMRLLERSSACSVREVRKNPSGPSKAGGGLAEKLASGAPVPAFQV
jgi:hypothetical protein